jgi:hypothetical protein
MSKGRKEVRDTIKEDARIKKKNRKTKAKTVVMRQKVTFNKLQMTFQEFGSQWDSATKMKRHERKNVSEILVSIMSDSLIMSKGTGLLFIPWVICEHGGPW